MKKAAETFAKQDKNVLSLLHSAFDVSQPLYNYAHWLGTLALHNQLVVNSPVAFGDYNEDNCQGFGVKSINDIEENAEILKLKTNICILGNDFTSDFEDEELSKKLEQHTDKQQLSYSLITKL